ncbi:hypothetical protein EPO15_08995 [bacterium]|nr:MAG: hypothetical protein EPO15_08995 [bacterium]
MRSALALLLALAVPATAANVRAPVPVAPLARLAPVLTAALAAPTLARPTLPGAQAPAPVLPASLSPALAQVLVARAAALPAVAVAAAPAQAAEAPAKALEAVNAVLKGVTPESLGAMSDDQLNAVGGLILDAMQGVKPRADAAAVAALSEAAAGRLKPLVGRPQLERSVYKPANDRHEEEIEVRGLPPGARLGRTDGSEVFRHYTTAEGRDSVLAGGGLWNGFVSYIQRSSGLWRKTFRGLDGVFLTKPGVSGDVVGVPAREFPRYVDVRLPAGLPLVELEAGRIFLVPLPARTRGWIADLYRRWASGGEVSPTYAKAVAELDAEGGPGPELALPVTVVASGDAK